MALFKIHILATYLGLYKSDNLDIFNKIVPFCILPDVIRCFGIPRVVSHFEENPKTKRSSFLVYPSESVLKNLNSENVKDLNFFKEDGYNQVGIGDKTDIEMFRRKNSFLLLSNPVEYFGILIHLLQDEIYDNFIRDVIDCSKRFENVFVFNNKCLDKLSVRKLINEFGEQEFRCLAHKFEGLTGVKPNMDWFATNVQPELEKVYSTEMIENISSLIEIDLDTPITKLLNDDDCEKIVNDLILVSSNFFKN